MRRQRKTAGNDERKLVVSGSLLYILLVDFFVFALFLLKTGEVAPEISPVGQDQRGRGERHRKGCEGVVHEYEVTDRVGPGPHDAAAAFRGKVPGRIGRRVVFA